MSHSTDPRRSLRLGFTAVLGGLAAFFAVSQAYAQECASNADCGSGFECVKGWSSPGCATPPDCPDSTPVESEFGSCEPSPITCQADTDCPSFLKCVASSDQTCWADSEGNTGCDPIDPNAPKSCEFVPIACAAATDCPANFDCIEAAVDCPPVACPEGQECTPPDCQPTGEKTCVPREISCEANADCPTDWLCAEFAGPDCAVAPPSTDGGTEPTPAPAPGVTPQDTTDCTSEPPVKLCMPPGFWAGGADGNASYESGSPTADTAGSASDPEVQEGMGCAVAATPSYGATWLAALAAAAVASIASRRLRRK